MNRRLIRSYKFLSSVFILILLGALLPFSSFGQFTITENFKGNSLGDITIGGNAKLTSGYEDPVNDGWLRLTTAQMSQVGWGVVNQSFPSTLGVIVDFEYVSWGGAFSYPPFVDSKGADGFSVFLYDASVPDANFSIGGKGGSLGYAQSVPPPNDPDPGLTGGYVGIGIDEFGNYSNPTEGRQGGPGQISNSIAIRGEAPNYSYINGTNTLPQTVDYEPQGFSAPTSRPGPGTYYRRVRVIITPLVNGKYTIEVLWKTSQNGSFVSIIKDTLNTPPPPYLKLGFAASTGQLFNYHEVRNVLITTPGGIRVEKSVDKTNANVGDPLTYTVTAYNATPAALNNIKLSDTLQLADGTLLSTTDFKIDGITFHNNGNSNNTATGFPNGQTISNTTNNFNSNLHLEANSSAYFTITGHIIHQPNGGIIDNVAHVDPSQTGITDTDTTNNKASVSTLVLNPHIDLKLTSSLSGACVNPSDGNSFSYLVSNLSAENKPVGGQVGVTITIPSGCTFSNAAAINGWLMTAPSGSTRTFYRVDGLASGKSYPAIPVEITVSSGSAEKKFPVKAVLSYSGDVNHSNDTTVDTLYRKPDAPVVATPLSLCQGSIAAPLTAEAEPGATLLWYSNPSGAGSSAPLIPSTNLPGSTTYYVSQRLGTCESDLASLDVNVNPRSDSSDIVVNGNDTLCTGETTKLTASLAAGSTITNPQFTWYGDPSLTTQVATGDSYTTPALNATTTYYVTVRGDGVCETGADSAREIEVYVGSCNVDFTKTAVITTDNGVQDKADKGDEITYTFSLTNSGSITLEGLSVTDPLEGLSALSYSWPDAANPGRLQPGEVVTATATYTVTQADVDSGQIVNQATATGKEPDGTALAPAPSSGNPSAPGHPGDDAGSTPATVVEADQSPSISLVKGSAYEDTNNDGIAGAGDKIAYTFTVTNTGNVTLKGISITDPKVTVSGGPVELAPGATDNTTFTGSYTITQADIDSGGVYNQATATGKDPKDSTITAASKAVSPLDPSDPNYNPDCPDCTFTPLTGTPSISLTKGSSYEDTNGDGVANAGDKIAYTFTVTNTGNVTLKGIAVSDPKVAVSGGPVELAPGATDNTTFTGSYTITQADIDSGGVYNQATATGKDPKDSTITAASKAVSPLAPSDPNYNPDCPDCTFTPLTGTTDVSFTKTAVITTDNGVQGKADKGDEITYTFSLTNSGSITLEGLSVTDTLTGLSALSYSWPDAANPGRLQPGEVVTATATYTVTQADVDSGQIVNQATATGKEPDGTALSPAPSSGNPSAPGHPGDDAGSTPATVVEADQSPSISLVKGSAYEDTNNDGIAGAGDKIAYTFTVTNTGNVTLKGISITDPKVTVSGGPVELAPGATDNTTFTGSYTITQADIDSGGVYNQATATGKDPQDSTITADSKAVSPLDPSDPNYNPDCPDCTFTPLTGKTDLSFTKTAVITTDNGVQGKADKGDEITYTFSLTNSGSITLEGLSVTDTLTGLSALSYSWPDAANPGRLQPGEVVTATATYTVTQADVDSGQIVNQATATGKEPDGTALSPAPSSGNPSAPGHPGDDAGSTPATVVEADQSPSISLTKGSNYEDTNGDGITGAGDKIAYTFTVTNTGNVTLKDIAVSDPKVAVSGGPVDLAPGATDNTTFTGSYTITQADIDSGGVYNQATATGKDPKDSTITADSKAVSPLDPSDPNYNPDCPDCTFTPLTGTPSISLTKGSTYEDTNGDGVANAGDKIAYTFTVTNTGNVTLKDIAVSDPKVTVSGGPVELAPGATDNTTFTGSYTITQADIDSGGVYNQATATGKDPKDSTITADSKAVSPLDPSDPNYNPDCPDCTFTPLTGNPSISLTKGSTYEDTNGDGVANAGDKIDYTFTVTNTGNVTLKDIAVSDPKVAVSGGPVELAPGATDNTTFTGSYTITQADIDSGGVYNQATATGKDPKDSTITAASKAVSPLDPSDPNYNPDCPECTFTPLTGNPSMTLVKGSSYEDTNGDGVAGAGDKIAYTFTVTNTGNVTLKDISVGDPKVTVSGGPVELAPGATDNTTFTGSYTITQADIDSGGVYNQATATGKDSQDSTITADSKAVSPLDPSDPNYDPDCPDCTFTPLTGLYSIGGTVFNDPDGGNVNNSTGTINKIPTGIYANLLDGGGKVISTIEVNMDGTYSLTAPDDQNYTVKLSDHIPAAGSILTAHFAAPQGWVYTGAYNGNENTGNTGDKTGESKPVHASETNAHQVNFGLNQLPETAVSESDAQIYPAPDTPFEVDGSLFIHSKDPAANPNTQDSSGGKVIQIRFTDYPAGIDSITIAGVTYTQETWPVDGKTVGYDPAKGVGGVAIYPNSKASEAVIPIAAIDNAGYEDPTPGSITIPFTCGTVEAPVVKVKESTATTITFEWLPMTGAAGYQVSTDGGNTWTTPSSGTTGTTHTVNGLAPSQSVTILVKAISNLPCQIESDASAPVTGTTENPLGNNFFIPNAFSPNGDGQNDTWKIYGNDIKEVYVMIYNQYGEKIYEFKDINGGWDGTYKGKMQPVAVYVYYAKITFMDNSTIEKSGSITLIR